MLQSAAASKFRARGGEFEGPAFVEADTEIPLEGVDLRAYRRLLNSVGHLPGRAADALGFCNVIEQLQLVRVHIDWLYVECEFYQLTLPGQAAIRWPA